MVKRRIVSTAFIALLTLANMGPVSAAPGSDNLSSQCKAVDDMGQTHGACVASATAGNFTPTIANFCRDEVVRGELAEALGLEDINHGQCVKFYEDIFDV
jgi:hypothetical protein